MRFFLLSNFIFQMSTITFCGKRINIAGGVSEINKDKGTRITIWLATRFPTQDSSWKEHVSGLCGLWGSVGYYIEVP